MTKMLDKIEKMVRGELPGPPIARLLGFTVSEISHGQCTVDFAADERHANPMGTLHGGVLCDIADAAMGLAHASTLEEGESFTTLELKINFLRPVWKARLKARARTVNHGRTISLIECDVTSDDGKLVARSNSTVMTLRGEQARGR